MEGHRNGTARQALPAPGLAQLAPHRQSPTGGGGAAHVPVGSTGRGPLSLSSWADVWARPAGALRGGGLWVHSRSRVGFAWFSNAGDQAAHAWTLAFSSCSSQPLQARRWPHSGCNFVFLLSGSAVAPQLFIRYLDRCRLAAELRARLCCIFLPLQSVSWVENGLLCFKCPRSWTLGFRPDPEQPPSQGCPAATVFPVRHR